MTDNLAPGAIMQAEVNEQPAALARLLDTQLGSIQDVAKQIQAKNPRFVMLNARGTSDHAAQYLKYYLEIKLGIPVGLSSPSVFTAYHAKPVYQDVVWISVSQSGGSPDLVEATNQAREAGCLTVAVTNAPESPLAVASELNIDVVAGPEKAVAATKSFTNQLLALYLLGNAWHGGDGAAAHKLPAYAQAVVDAKDASGVAERYRFAEKMITTGRGYAYPIAREGALKLMETTYLAAQPFSSADLMHGPMAMVDPGHPVIAIVPEGTGGEAIQPVLDRLQENRADVLVVGDQNRVGNAAAFIPLPTGIPEEISPIIQIIPLQQLAHDIAVSRGNNPDAPRGLRKVTETR